MAHSTPLAFSPMPMHLVKTEVKNRSPLFECAGLWYDGDGWAMDGQLK